MSLITDTVREVQRPHPELIAEDSVLARVCDNILRVGRDVPDWAKLEGLKIPDVGYSLQSGDMAVLCYWHDLEREMLQLTLSIEQRETGDLVAQVDDPIANHALADLVGLSRTSISKQIRKALHKAGIACKKVEPGHKRSWSHAELRSAYPNLPDGELKKWVDRKRLRK